MEKGEHLRGRKIRFGIRRCRICAVPQCELCTPIQQGAHLRRPCPLEVLGLCWLTA